MAAIWTYRTFGLDLATDSPLELLDGAPLSGAGSPPAGAIRLSTRAGSLGTEAGGAGREAREPFYSSSQRLPGGSPLLTLAREGDRDVFTFPGVGEFTLGASSIDVRAEPGCPRVRMETWLLGPVLAFWLERSGALALHGSAVTFDGRAVGFVGGKGAGKSTLAGFLVLAGCRALTDDLLAVDGAGATPEARPGPPFVRLWAEQARRLLGRETSPSRRATASGGQDGQKVRLRFDQGESIPRSGGADAGGPEWGRDRQARPLARLYLPERREGIAHPRLEPLAPREALMALVSLSALPRIAEALGWQGRRLQALAALVRAVPVRRLVYPDGVEHLDAVRTALEKDLASA